MVLSLEIMRYPKVLFQERYPFDRKIYLLFGCQGLCLRLLKLLVLKFLFQLGTQLYLLNLQRGNSPVQGQWYLQSYNPLMVVKRQRLCWLVLMKFEWYFLLSYYSWCLNFLIYGFLSFCLFWNFFSFLGWAIPYLNFLIPFCRIYRWSVPSSKKVRRNFDRKFWIGFWYIYPLGP